jgi:N-methylhydantoinase B
MKRDSKINRIDPITVEVINNALAAIAEEITINLARTAHSTIVYEVQDFCTGLLDAQGRLVAQAPGGLPLFVGDLDAAVEDGIRIHGENGFQPGDVILTNHTGTCGQHLNNVVVYTPVFFEGERVGFAATRAHWTDVGGRLAGGPSGGRETQERQQRAHARLAVGGKPRHLGRGGPQYQGTKRRAVLRGFCRRNPVFASPSPGQAG